MVHEEIVTGLRNAVSRGESLEKAMQSMISAGYSPEDVQEASGYVEMGVIGKLPEAPEAEEKAEQPAKEKEEREEKQEKAEEAEAEKSKKKVSKLAIALIIILILLLAGIGALMMFGEKILSALFGGAA